MLSHFDILVTKNIIVKLSCVNNVSNKVNYIRQRQFLKKKYICTIILEYFCRQIFSYSNSFSIALILGQYLFLCVSLSNFKLSKSNFQITYLQNLHHMDQMLKWVFLKLGLSMHLNCSFSHLILLIPARGVNRAPNFKAHLKKPSPSPLN